MYIKERKWEVYRKGGGRAHRLEIGKLGRGGMFDNSGL